MSLGFVNIQQIQIQPRILEIDSGKEHKLMLTPEIVRIQLHYTTLHMVESGSEVGMFEANFHDYCSWSYHAMYNISLPHQLRVVDQLVIHQNH